MERREAERRRRRVPKWVLIAGAAAVLVAAAFWVTRRPLDPRVAGRWSFTVTHNATADKRRLIDFRSDGWIRTSYVDGTSVPNVANGRWWVEKNQVVVLSGSDNSFRRLWSDLQIFVIHVLGRPEPWDVSRYEIVEVGPDRLRLRFLPHPGEPGEDGDWVLTRPAQ